MWEFIKETIQDLSGPTPMLVAFIILIYVQDIKNKIKKVEKMLEPYCKSD